MAHYSRRRFEQDVPEVMVAAQTVTSIFVTLGQVMRERIGKFASVEVLNESNYSHIGSRHHGKPTLDPVGLDSHNFASSFCATGKPCRVFIS
jgi:hypothetical protein